MKKVLAVDFKHDFPNRTNHAFYSALEKKFNVVYYGPGHVPDIDGLDESLVSFYNKTGPYDACFIHKALLYYLDPIKEDTPFFTYDDKITKYYFDTKEFTKKKPNFGRDYAKLPGPKFLVSMLLDFYCFGHDWYFEKYGNFPGYLLIPPVQCALPVEQLPDLNKEKFYDHCTDRYIKFNQQYSSKIIPLAHMIMEDEFDFQVSKNEQFAVPGVLYHERAQVLKTIKKSSIIKARNKYPTHKLIESLFKSRVIKYNYPVIRDYYRTQFKRLISDSLMTYTDGSRLKIFIKKFLEIPTFGSLLLCDPFTDAENFGFIENKHYIRADSRNITEVVENLKSKPDLCEQIARAAQNMVRELHTDVALADTFKEMVELAIDNKLIGGRWINGKLVFNA